MESLSAKHNDKECHIYKNSATVYIPNSGWKNII